jgi:thioredoxin reductase
MSDPDYDVAIIGGGVAGLAASIFTARHDFETVVLDAGRSILRRNAHLENYPGFPAGINSRVLLESMEAQAEGAGTQFEAGRITDLQNADEEFIITAEDGATWTSQFVIAATKNNVDYLKRMDGVDIIDRGKEFVDVDDRGRTGVPGLYAAGRLARKPHQAIVAAGHGAEVAVTLLEDAADPFYHDWVAPEQYFTGRDRDVPPGVEEIDEAERRDREAESLEWFEATAADPHPETPDQHPSVE